MQSFEYETLRYLLQHSTGKMSLLLQHYVSNGKGLPGSSAGEESTCNAGDSSSILGSGSSPGEGIGCPLQSSWASLVAQMVKNPPSMWKNQVQSLGWKDPLEECKATHSSILAWRIPMDRGGWWATDHGIAKSWTRLSDLAQHRNGRLAASVSGGSRWWLRW